MNQLGWCMGIEKAEFLHGLGYDFIECTVTGLNLENPELSKKRIAQYRDAILPVRAVNVFLPGDLKVVGPEVDTDRVNRYIELAAESLDRIGTHIAVFGSGKARMVPEGWERAKAEEQILKFLAKVAKEFETGKVKLVIEPLNKKESNIINSVAEGAYYAKEINHPSIRVLADFYHMDEDQEALDTILEHKDWLDHIHLADTGRKSPGTGKYPYDTFMQLLKTIDYQGMLSVECKVEDEALDVPASLRFIKDYLK